MRYRHKTEPIIIETEEEIISDLGNIGHLRCRLDFLVVKIKNATASGYAGTFMPLVMLDKQWNKI